MAQTPPAAQTALSFRIVATELEGPWEITWGPDDYLWITERAGKRVTRVNPADGTKTPAAVISEVYSDYTQDGLLGMALDPRLLGGRGSDYVYVAYTYDADAGSGVNRRGKVRRYTYNEGTHTLGAPVDLISNLPAGSDHIGFRLRFGPDDKLYLTVGDQGSNWLRNFCNANRAQDLPTAAEIASHDWTTYQGKVLRLNLDGSIPSDNPVLNGVRSHVYSYGHRNPQGLVFGPDRILYESEHGPDTDDEVNVIEAGKNYGWPFVAGYRDDNVYVWANWSASSPAPCASLAFDPHKIPASVPQQQETAWNHPDFRPPLQTLFTKPKGYDPDRDGPATIAPSGMDIYTARDGFSGWANSLLVTSMTRGRIYRMKLGADGRTVVGEPAEHFRTQNRYRDLAINPTTHSIYVSTDNGGPTLDDSGRSTNTLLNPGQILEFMPR
jgi:PQQ-dependent dehydrogenase (s-GDH family)